MPWSISRVVKGAAAVVAAGIVALTLLFTATLWLARPRIAEVDPTVRAPETRLADVVELPGWTALVVDSTDADGFVSTMAGTVGGVAIREVEGALLVRGVRFRGGGADPDTLPAFRIALDSLAASPATQRDWHAAGPTTAECPGAWRVEGDPFQNTSPSSRPTARAADLDPRAVAGAHVLLSHRSADGRAEAVVSAAGPLTAWSNGWEEIGGARYAEVVPLAPDGPQAEPVRLPDSTDWEAPCWSPSGRFVIVPSRPSVLGDPFRPEAVRLAVLRAGV